MASEPITEELLKNLRTDIPNYTFPTEPVPRLPHDSPEAERLISEHRPVILTGSKCIESALHWDLDYLTSHIGSGSYTVYSSKTNKFLYYDDKKLPQNPDFSPPTRHMDMTFPEFVQRMKNPSSSEKIYLQQSLNDSVGQRVVLDFRSFNWEWVTSQQVKQKWGPLTSNLLLIGMEGVITPCHYDEQENLFAQIRGYKRFLLFEPEQFGCLYPYPVYHPHDRQSQVNFNNPDFERFPKFREAKAMEAIVGPGDVLYLPVYWWHQVESIANHGYTMSVNFWFKCGPTEKIVYPLSASQKVAMTRNIEKMINDALNDSREVPSFMQTMVLGRYT